jgi:hypothetical protein
VDNIEVILETLSFDERNSLIEKLAERVRLEHKEAEYWEGRYNDERNAPTVDVVSYNSTIERLSRDVAYWKSVAEARQVTINQTMLVRGKEQCALGIINQCQGRNKALLDCLFSDTPDYRKAWREVPWQLLDAVSSIDIAKKIERIKLVRAWMPGLGLKQVKDFVEAHWQYDKQYVRTSE